MKRTFTRTFFLALLCLCTVAAFAQNIVVKGKVTDGKDKQSLPGVTVKLSGGTTATQTDADGNYTISAPANGTLSFSYIGYTTQDVAITNRTTLNVEMGSSATSLEQVVVVGYGTQRRRDVTGSVGNVRLAVCR
jgi:hypothetical protein